MRAPATAAIIGLVPAGDRAITTSDAKIVIVGDKAWLASGSDTYQSVPSAMVTPLLAGYDLAALLLAFGAASWAPSSHDLGTEQKNGVSAHHYQIDTTLLSAYASTRATWSPWRRRASRPARICRSRSPTSTIRPTR